MSARQYADFTPLYVTDPSTARPPRVIVKVSEEIDDTVMCSLRDEVISISIGLPFSWCAVNVKLINVTTDSSARIR